MRVVPSLDSRRWRGNTGQRRPRGRGSHYPDRTRRQSHLYCEQLILPTCGLDILLSLLAFVPPARVPRAAVSHRNKENRTHSILYTGTPRRAQRQSVSRDRLASSVRSCRSLTKAYASSMLLSLSIVGRRLLGSCACVAGREEARLASDRACSFSRIAACIVLTLSSMADILDSRAL